MWILILNDMRASKVEEGDRYAARADTKEALERFYAAELVDKYTDGKWTRFFRKGGPLEWANNMTMLGDGPQYVEAPSREQFIAMEVEKAGEFFDTEILSLPEAT